MLAWTLYKNRTNIATATDFLRFAASFVSTHPLIIFVALACFILQIITFLLTIYLLLIIHPSGDFAEDDGGSPLPKFKYTFFKWIYWCLGILTVYWTVIFWNNFADIVCASSTLNFYYHKAAGTLRTVVKCMIAHTGSVAMASLVLLPVTLVQAVFGWFYAMFISDRPNMV